MALSVFAAFIAPPLAAQAGKEEVAAEGDIAKEDFFRPGIAPVRAPAGYDLTIVYFMDYQCPSCRQYTPDVARVLAEDRKVRMIYRDTPIISDLSTVAARAAIAAAFQGRHDAFHHALMMTKGRLTETAIRAAATRAGVDWARLQRDLKARGEAIDQQIGRNVELAVTTGIMGTPAFIVGERLSNGALDYASLKAEIADARAAAGIKAVVAPPLVEKDDLAPEAPAMAQAEPSTAPAPIFRRVEQPQRTPSAAVRETGPSSRLVWLAVVGLLAAVAAGVWFARRRRSKAEPGPSRNATQSRARR